MSGNSLADDRGLEGKISRCDFLKLIFAASSAITLFPLIQLTRIYGPIVSDADVIDRYRVGEVDKYGILKLYPTKTGGLEWFNKWDNGKSRTLEEGDKDPYDARFHLSCGQPNIPLLIDGTGRAIVQAFTSSARLFVSGPWLNTEMTVYVKGMTALRDVQLRSRSNHEKDCCFGNYGARWLRDRDKKVSIECEPMHPFYARHLDEKSYNGFSLGHYVGFKQVTKTIEGGNKVKVEGWFNDSANDSMDQTKWIKQTEFVFDGKNINSIVVQPNDPISVGCTGKGDNIAPNFNQKTLWLNSGQWCWIRANHIDKTRFRYFSVREIAI